MLSKFSIGAKIALGFSCVVTIMLLILAFAIKGLSSSSDDFKVYREFARESVLSGRVQANMLMASRAAGNFLKTRDESFYDVFNTRITQAKGFANEQQEAMDDPERRALSVDLVNNIDQYQSVSDQVFQT